jgi:two-component system chemotaxis response regulator CheY
MNEGSARVLDVGQCSPDHSAIRSLLHRTFNVYIDQAGSVDEAIEELKTASYDLVLVNRVIFEDGGSGAELIAKMKSVRDFRDVPVMMISNFNDAQQDAVAAGGVPGFGKAELNDPSTIALLRKYLPSRAEEAESQS